MAQRDRRAAIEAALRGVDRVPEKERLHILAWKAHMDGRDAEARELYARAVERYPQDKEALFMAGDLYLHGGSPAEALPFFERAAALDPSWEPAQMHVMDSLAETGRVDELARRAAAWVERAPTAASYRALARAHAAGGRMDDAVAAARRALALDGTSHSRGMLGEMLLAAGRYEEAEELARPLLLDPRSALDRVVAIYTLAAALAGQGRRREALEVAATFPEGGDPAYGSGRLMQIEILAGDPDATALAPEVRALGAALPGEKRRSIALTLALLGDREGAVRAHDALDGPGFRTQLDAALAWRAGDAGRMLEPLRAAARDGARPDAKGTLWLLAHAALDAGNPAEAAAAVDRLGSPDSGLLWTWGWPRALYLKAVALERLGDGSGALETVGRLLATWRRADPDLPLLAEARALDARLRAAR
jgi:tetratricopeptide (TPR) repeat protein